MWKATRTDSFVYLARSLIKSTWDPEPKFCLIPRKEVIQPHLPVRLPCYDFTPITDPTLDACLRKPG
jgi:hypothetical protein